MKRLLAILAVLMASASFSHADYVIVRMNLGASPPPKKEEDTPKQPLPLNRPLLPTLRTGPVAPVVVQGAPISVIALIEYNRNLVNPLAGTQPRADQWNIEHVWGRTLLQFDQKTIQVYPLRDVGFKGKLVVRPTPPQIFEVRWKDLLYDKSAPATKFLELADWALTNGLETKVPELMKQAASRNQENSDPAVAKVLAAYNQVSKQLEEAPSRDEAFFDPSGLDGFKTARSDHYSIWFDAPVGSSPEVDSRLKKLEQNYRAIFWWFALRGHALPVPQRRLVALQIDRPSDFRQYQAAFAMPELTTDGFHVPRQNLVVFSSLPLDLPYELASRQFRELTQSGWDLRALLNPKQQFPAGKAIADIPHAQTLALIQKKLHEESEVASVSQIGTRQLLTATGLLPRTVLLPEWIQSGLPSFFESPKFSHESLTGSFWVTWGAPHWVYHALWRDYEERKALDPADKALLDVVSDRGFRALRLDPRDPTKPRVMAWSLTYFLAHRKLDQLLAYCRELGGLPRDLELSDDIYLGCFARAFNLNGSDGKLDQSKVRALAEEWYKFVAIAAFPELSQDTQKALVDMRKK